MAKIKLILGSENMRKVLLSLIAIVLFIPVIVNAKENIYIDSIESAELKGEAIELEEATANDKTVNLNLRMTNKNDEVKYKLVIKNETEEDYEINKNNISTGSDYVDYSLESDNNNIIKSNTSKTVYLRVKYSNEVNQSNFVNGVYQDNITMKLNLRSNDNNILNPNTGLPYLIIISLVLIISGISLIVFKKKKLSTLTILIGILLLPIGVKALKSYEITIDSKVKIQIEDEFKIKNRICSNELTEYTIKYRIGSTLNEFKNSKYYDDAIDEGISVVNSLFSTNDEFITKFIADNEFDNCISEANSDAYVNNCKNQYLKEINYDDKIINKEKVYYYIFEDNCLI